MLRLPGNYRLRYRGSQLKDDAYAYGTHSSFDYRARVIFNAKVNDKPMLLFVYKALVSSVIALLHKVKLTLLM